MAASGQKYSVAVSFNSFLVFSTRNNSKVFFIIIFGKWDVNVAGCVLGVPSGMTPIYIYQHAPHGLTPGPPWVKRDLHASVLYVGGQDLSI